MRRGRHGNHAHTRSRRYAGGHGPGSVAKPRAHPDTGAHAHTGPDAHAGAASDANARLHAATGPRADANADTGGAG